MFQPSRSLSTEAVRTYAELYSKIYQQVLAEKDVQTAIERILTDSVHEFTQPSDTHPGCLISSAVMTDSTNALDISAYVAELHSSKSVTVFRSTTSGVMTCQTVPDLVNLGQADGVLPGTGRSPPAARPARISASRHHPPHRRGGRAAAADAPVTRHAPWPGCNRVPGSR